MKHYIIAKFKKEYDARQLVSPITDLFGGVLQVPGIHGVNVIPNCVDRPNRFDLMIEIDMDREALEAYDACEAHKRWKREYGDMLEAKTIFDRM